MGCRLGGPGLSQHSPVHGEFLRQQAPVIAPGVGGVQAVAYFLADGQRDLEGIGSQLGGDRAAGGRAKGIQGASRSLEGQGARVRGAEGSPCLVLGICFSSLPDLKLRTRGDSSHSPPPIRGRLSRLSQRTSPLGGQLLRARAACPNPSLQGLHHINGLPRANANTASGLRSHEKPQPQSNP